MKICLVGSLLPTEVFDNMVRCSKSKPSNAPENFQMMLAKGLSELNEGLTVISFPTIATYPKGPKVLYAEKHYAIEGEINIISPPMVNVQLVKQQSIYLSTYKYVKKWLQSVKDKKKIVLVYSDYPPYANACRKACAEDSDAICVLLMTDLPTYSLTKHKLTPYSWMMCKMDAERRKNYNKFDAYIVLTKYMIEKMKINEKPCIVIEGFSDPSQFEFDEIKCRRKTMMYAGALSDVHNIRALIDAIKETKVDADFWFYGDGNQKEYVIEATKQDKRIQYFGKVSRKELLHAQKKAHILVSVKSSMDDHNKYAFPSKILEYMTSGTAVLTTKIAGIPNEYFDYVYQIEDESVAGIVSAIDKVFTKSMDELTTKGKEAKKFVSSFKNYLKQGEKILTFLNEL